MRNLLFTCALAFALLGCSKEENRGELLDSDANGFLCRQCNLKFYTARSIYADICPACKSTDIVQVIGFFCDKDQHVTLTPKAKSATCEKCSNPVGQVRLPTAAQLTAWGAVKKSSSDVKQH
jgi:hypothetical protein